MGLTSAMLVGFTGIKSNQSAIDTIGDNVANVNTNGFKNQRSMFESVFYRTVSEGSAPEGANGGTNPMQIGYGSGVASFQRNFAQGVPQLTGIPSDLAVDGEGFFVLNTPAGDRAFTRNGAFALNNINELVTSTGDHVQGFAADQDGTIIAGQLTNLAIPIGVESAAVTTSEVILEGNLDATATPATTPAVVTSAALMTTGGPANSGSALTSLIDENNQPIYAAGDTIRITGVQKGGIDMPETNFIVGTDGSTLGDLADFLEQSLALSNTSGSAGVTIGDGTNGPEGSIIITSDLGEVNAISMDASSIRNDTTGSLLTSFTGTPADGEGTTTSFVVFDSLGNPVSIRIRSVMESQTDAGNVWRFFAESADAGSLGQPLGSGTISFDQDGQFVAATDTTLSIDRSGTGAVSPMSVVIDPSRINGLADPDGESVMVMSSQDGVPAGTLIGYGIDENGVIEGTFSNGASKIFGQVALATFANPQGLVASSGTTFLEGLNSGPAAVIAPNTGSAGSIQSGALEASNVDLSREFVGLITASTGFSAASRVVRTADELLQELLLLAR